MESVIQKSKIILQKLKNNWNSQSSFERQKLFQEISFLASLQVYKAKIKDENKTSGAIGNL